MATYLPTHVGVDYRAALNGENNGKQYLDIYYPVGLPVPGNGWPVVLWYLNTGLVASTRPGFVSEAQDDMFRAREELLANGYALVDVEMTVAVLATTTGEGLYIDEANPAPHATLLWDLNGDGSDLCETDAITAIQYIRYNASQYSLDSSRIAVAGVSGGAIVASYVCGAQRADPGNDIAQRKVSSRPSALIFLKPASYFRGFCLNDSAGGPANQYFSKSANPLLAAVDGLECNLTQVLHASPHHFMFQSPAKEINELLPVYIRTEGIVGDGDLGSLNPEFNPTTFAPLYLGTATTGLTSLHDAFHGAALMVALRLMEPDFHGEHTRATGTVDWGTHGVDIDPDEVIANDDLAAIDVVEWLTLEMPDTFVAPIVPQALIAEIEAVNTILATIGEGKVIVDLPVDPEDEDATNATDCLAQVSRNVQMEGWHFNKVKNVDLPAFLGFIPVPTDALRIDASDPNRNVTRKGQVLFDLDNNTDSAWTSSLSCDITYLRAFQDLPPSAQWYITIRAARLFVDRYLGSDVVRGYTAQEELAARNMLMDEEGDVGDDTIFGNHPANHILRRRSPMHGFFG